MSLRFHDIGATIEGRLERVMSAIKRKRRTTSRCSDLQGEFSVQPDDKENEEIAVSTQFLSTQNNQLIELPEHF